MPTRASTPLLLVLLLLSAGLAIAEPSYERAYVTGDEVRLRTAPSTQAPVAGAARRGQAVGVLSRKPGWVEVVPLETFVPGDALAADGKVGEGGAELRLDLDGPAFCRVPANVVLASAVHGRPWTLVEGPPPGVRYWIAEQFVDRQGIPVRATDLVAAERLAIGRADFARIAALKGLRMVVLPTGDVGEAVVESADSSNRFGPSYSVRYRRGSDWLEVSAGTSGFGGPALDQPRFQVQSSVLGKVLMTTMDYGDRRDLMSSSAPLLEASTLEGRACPLSLFFGCNPEADPAWVRAALESVRAVRLPAR